MDRQQILANTSIIDIGSGPELTSDGFINWDGAACRGADTDLFFPDDGDHVGIERAKQVCSRCPIAWECLSYAVWTNQTEGIWGGMTRVERRKVRRRLAARLRDAS